MSTPSSSSKNMLTLKSSDNEEFTVEESVAVQSVLIQNLVEDDCSNTTIPLLNVTGEYLALVIEYLKKHADSTASEVDRKTFDSEFVEKSMPDLCHLVLAANYLNIKDLLDILNQKIADRIKDETPENVRKIFNIENDYSPEEEEVVRKDDAWAFE